MQRDGSLALEKSGYYLFECSFMCVDTVRDDIN